jgi:hypothetical protein
MTLSAFKTTFLVAIDDQEAVEEEYRTPEQGPVTEEELKTYLNSALRIDVDTENFGNAIGWQSAEVAIDELTELSPEEMKARYG